MSTRSARPSEWAWIDLVRRILVRGPRRGVRVDIGDDAAVLAPMRAPLVLSVDTAVEDRHFRRAWMPLDVIGARAFEAAASDLAAMGARPVAALLALALPADTREPDVAALARGVARAARRTGCPVVGGNFTGASEISITTTVIGSAERPLRRDGARMGDRVFVTGTPGAAALGLAVLQRGREGRVANSAAFVRRFARPEAQIDAGLALVGRASAAIDLSDGIVSDASHVARASGVRITIDATVLPMARHQVRVAEALGLDARVLALTGGEDYELLFTAPRGVRLPIAATEIGVVERGRGVRVLGEGGRPMALARAGFDHFRASSRAARGSSGGRSARGRAGSRRA